MTILLGFEIGSGRRIEVPAVGHLAWFGQTQLSGKTTALEAMVYRGGLKAVAFITKQGEGSFLLAETGRGGRLIQPFFSEPTNDAEQPLWRWVKSILEASQQRRMNFEESWIIRACEDPRQAKSLADVHENIKALLEGEAVTLEKGRGRKKKSERKWIRKPVTGMHAGVYTSLKAYFDIVMPQLARLPYTTRLKIAPGLNVMDLRQYAMETQALVIRSVMEWVYQRENNVRVIVPEAQDFVPQGKNSPVKMACETLVRKGGAQRNFMWLDSQDMAAVDKNILRACSIVGCGVQTEINEIDRVLASLFTEDLKPVDIAKLRKGEFFVRMPEARVTKVYVQPAWMDSEIHAAAIARGDESVDSARAMLRAFKETARDSDDDESTGTSEHDGTEVGRVSPAAEEPARRSARTGNSGDGDDSDGKTRWETSPDTARAATAAAAWRVGERCPSCDSPAPHLHPAVQSEGEVQPCSDPFHAIVTNQNSEEMIRDAAKLSRPQAGFPESESHADEIQTEVHAETDPPGDRDRLDAGTASVDDPQPAPPATGVPPRAGEADQSREEDPMWADYASKIEKIVTQYGTIEEIAWLIDQYRLVVCAHDAMVARLIKLETGKREHGVKLPADTGKPASGNGRGDADLDGLETIYRFIRDRMLADPGVLKVLASTPELHIKTERVTLQADGNSLRGRLALLITKKFFDQPRTGQAAFNELKRQGARVAKPSVYRELDNLAELGFVTSEADGYAAVAGMKIRIEE